MTHPQSPTLHWDPVQGAVRAHRDVPPSKAGADGLLGKLSLVACSMAFFMFIVVGGLMNYFNNPHADYAALAGVVFMLLGVAGGAKFIMPLDKRQLILKHHIIAAVGRKFDASVHLFVKEKVTVKKVDGRIDPVSLAQMAAQSFTSRDIPMTIGPAQIAYILETEGALSGSMNRTMLIDLDDPFEFELRGAVPAFSGISGMSAVTASPFPPDGLLWWTDGTTPRWVSLGFDVPGMFNPQSGGWKGLKGTADASCRMIMAVKLKTQVTEAAGFVLTPSGVTLVQKTLDAPFTVVFAAKSAHDNPHALIPDAAQEHFKKMARLYGAEFYVSGDTLYVRSTLPLPSILKESAKAAQEVAVALEVLGQDIDHLATLF